MKIPVGGSSDPQQKLFLMSIEIITKRICARV
jgi:hypothetical protein